MFFRNILFILLSLLCLAACKELPDDEQQPSVFKRTVLIYMSAENSLASQNIVDSTEVMKGAKYLRKGERVLMFMDRGGNTRLYEVVRGSQQPHLAKKWDSNLNTADPATLTMALQYMQTHFASESYGLVLWSHATGWLPSPKLVEQELSLAAATQVLAPDFEATKLSYAFIPSGATKFSALQTIAPRSFGVDVGEGGNIGIDRAANNARADEMELSALSSAIAASGAKLRFILFDCCLMQGIETLYELRNAADYLAGSPIEIAAEGADYTDLMYDGFFSDNIEDLGKSYVRHYMEENNPVTKRPKSKFGLVFNIVRSDKLQAVADSLRKYMPGSFSRDASGSLQYPDLDGIQQYEFYYFTLGYRPHCYDLQHAMSRILSAQGQTALRRALDSAIVYKAATEKFKTGATQVAPTLPVYEQAYCGISGFVPQRIYNLIKVAECPYGNLNLEFRKTAWYRAAGWDAAGW